MIIQLDGHSAGDVEAAKQDLTALVSGWGHELTDAPTVLSERPAGAEQRDEKAVDPVSLIALIVSLPSAALAVYDLADRIRKRRRAAEMIDRARQLATRGVSVYVMDQHTPRPINTLDPDSLLDLVTDDPSGARAAGQGEIRHSDR